MDFTLCDQPSAQHHWKASRPTHRKHDLITQLCCCEINESLPVYTALLGYLDVAWTISIRSRSTVLTCLRMTAKLYLNASSIRLTFSQYRTQVIRNFLRIS